MEHPAEAEHRADVPSSWRLPILVRLMGMPGVLFHRIDQCQFGQSAKKPTGLLTVHVPSMRRKLREMPHRGRCTHRAHASVLEGRASNGEWNTSRAKTYPSAMCRFLAECVHEESARQFSDPGGPPLDLPEDVAPYFVPLDPYFSFQRGRDYARETPS